MACKQTIKSLNVRLDDLRTRHAPKPRFAFKHARRNPLAVSLTDAAATDAPAATVTRPDARVRSLFNTPDLGVSALASTPGSTTSPREEHKGDADAPPDANDTPIEAPTYDQQRDDTGPPSSARSGRASHRIRRPSFASQDRIVISQEAHAHIVLPTSAAQHATGAGTISHVRGCAIDLFAATLAPAPVQAEGTGASARGSALAGLTLRDVRGSLLVCGRVAGPAHATGLQECVLVVACGQLRLHACRNTVVYLWCASRPVVEDCVGVRFARLPAAYVSWLRLCLIWEFLSGSCRAGAHVGGVRHHSVLMRAFCNVGDGGCARGGE